MLLKIWLCDDDDDDDIDDGGFGDGNDADGDDHNYFRESPQRW